MCEEWVEEEGETVNSFIRENHLPHSTNAVISLFIIPDPKLKPNQNANEGHLFLGKMQNLDKFSSIHGTRITYCTMYSVYYVHCTVYIMYSV